MAETKGPLAGFGKGVNNYLNDYVKVSDAKAAAFLAANLAAATLVLRIAPTTWLPSACRWLSLASFATSTCFCAWTVFPRLPKGHMGVVFWEDILFFKSAELYERELAAMDDAAVESEYAAQISVPPRSTARSGCSTALEDSPVLEICWRRRTGDPRSPSCCVT